MIHVGGRSWERVSLLTCWVTRSCVSLINECVSACEQQFAATCSVIQVIAVSMMSRLINLPFLLCITFSKAFLEILFRKQLIHSFSKGAVRKVWTPKSQKVLYKQSCEVFYLYDFCFSNGSFYFTFTLVVDYAVKRQLQYQLAVSLCYRHLEAESWRTLSSLLFASVRINISLHWRELTEITQPKGPRCTFENISRGAQRTRFFEWRLKQTHPRAVTANESVTVKCVHSTCGSVHELFGGFFLFSFFCVKPSAPCSFLNKRRNLKRWLCTHTVGV